MAARHLKPLTFLALAAPLLWLLYAIVREIVSPGVMLGADPADAVVDFLGEWSLRVLLLALAISPLRRLLGWPELARVRRMAGLFAFTYVSLHLLAYVVLLAGLDFGVLVEDVFDRPYITLGMAAFACLLPLAVTSTRGWQKRLGRTWRSLHRLVFPALGLALLHLAWLTKDGYAELAVYTLVFALLVGERLSYRRRLNPGFALQPRQRVP